MLLLMAVSLYTSRVVLDKLGVSDYGIYNVVGGIVGMLGFLNSSMSNAVQRYLSFAMGRDDTLQINRVFNVSLLAHIIIAVFVLTVMEIAGVWYLDNYLNVPNGRLYAAQWVLQTSIITTIFSVIQVPYTAIIIAKEQMGIYAYLSILEAILKLAIVYLLVVSPFDRLISYSVLISVVQILMLLINRFYCIRKYKEVKFHFIKDWKLLKEIVGFASWNVLGEIAWVFTGQGVNMILNVFFSPAVNAARGIADQVNGAMSKFVSNFQVALNPQIIKTYAAHEWDDTMNLVYRGTRFSYYLLFTLSFPIIIEMDKILHFWLKEVPPYTTVFCQLILIVSIIMSVTNLMAQVARAYGNIRNYQIIVSFVIFLNFPLSYLVLKIGFSPASTMVISVVIQFVLIFVRLALTKKMINFTYLEYAKQVFVPIIKVSFIASIIPVILRMSLHNCLASFFLILGISFLSVAICSYIFGMDVHERALIQKGIKNAYHKISSK